MSTPRITRSRNKNTKKLETIMEILRTFDVGFPLLEHG